MNSTAEMALECVRNEFASDASKIILYGSVARSTSTDQSDIDVAVILHDWIRSLPLDMEGLPLGTTDRLRGIREKYDTLKMHVVFYWESEYARGIELYSGRRHPPDKLHEVGKIFFDYKDTE